MTSLSLIGSALAPVLIAAAAWLPPIAPLVVERPFSPPIGPYSAGHRGVDLRAPAGTAVRAPGPGVVRVAGRVAGKDVVSIEHPHRILGRIGWRTTYEGVTAEVDVGEQVRAGQRIGTVTGSPSGDAHTAGVHWGLKNGRTYADPLILLRNRAVLKPLAADG